MTRALRARLSYASYKATHNVSHVPIRELEGQLLSQTQAASFNRIITAKRKSAPAPSSSSASGPAHHRRGPSGSSGSMPPPATASSPRTHHSTVSGSSAPGSASLYASILAPRAQVARTVRNANDHPVPPSSRPAPSPRVRTVKPSPKSAADGSRTHAKAKQPDKKTAASPERRKAKRASLDKAKGKQRSRARGANVDADGDVDMKAAATLTSLLLNNRSMHGGSTHSPRSSIDGSETGSAYSYSHFAQSSARSTTAASPPGSISSVTAMTGVEPSPYRHQQTPPPGPVSPVTSAQHSTPRPAAPTDNEAADLMLFLATSPSPARPTPKQRDPSTYRTLGNESPALRSKGRILFPSSSAPDVMVHDEPTGSKPQSTLARTSDGNYTLSTSHGDGSSRNVGDLHGVASRTLSSSSSSSMITPSQLLPPPSLPSAPSPSSAPRMPESPPGKDAAHSPKAVFGSGGASVAEFNFNEFINASPSPSRPQQHHKRDSSLRADVGRKLFEEEQMRHHSSTSMGHSGSPGKGRNAQSARGLGAGIDIVHS